MTSRIFGSVLLVLGVTAFFSSIGMIEWDLLNDVAFVQQSFLVLLFSFAVFHLFK
ncbi:MAG: hypothetical protein ABIJ74_03700 [archaeon]